MHLSVEEVRVEFALRLGGCRRWGRRRTRGNRRRRRGLDGGRRRGNLGAGRGWLGRQGRCRRRGGRLWGRGGELLGSRRSRVRSWGGWFRQLRVVRHGGTDPVVEGVKRLGL